MELEFARWSCSSCMFKIVNDYDNIDDDNIDNDIDNNNNNNIDNG